MTFFFQLKTSCAEKTKNQQEKLIFKKHKVKRAEKNRIYVDISKFIEKSGFRQITLVNLNSTSGH